MSTMSSTIEPRSYRNVPAKSISVLFLFIAVLRASTLFMFYSVLAFLFLEILSLLLKVLSSLYPLRLGYHRSKASF